VIASGYEHKAGDTDLASPERKSFESFGINLCQCRGLGAPLPLFLTDPTALTKMHNDSTVARSHLADVRGTAGSSSRHGRSRVRGASIAGIIFFILIALVSSLTLVRAGGDGGQADAEIVMGMYGLPAASGSDRGAAFLEECARTACVAAKAAEIEAREQAEREAALQAAREAEAARQAALWAASNAQPVSPAPAQEPERQVRVINCIGTVNPIDPTAPITYYCDDGTSYQQ